MGESQSIMRQSIADSVRPERHWMIPAVEWRSGSLTHPPLRVIHKAPTQYLSVGRSECFMTEPWSALNGAGMRDWRLSCGHLALPGSSGKQVKNAKLTAVKGDKNAMQAKEALCRHGAQCPVQKPSIANFSRPSWILCESAERKQLHKHQILKYSKLLTVAHVTWPGLPLHSPIMPASLVPSSNYPGLLHSPSMSVQTQHRDLNISKMPCPAPSQALGCSSEADWRRPCFQYTGIIFQLGR